MKLNTDNANHFVYQTEELLIELLGAIRIDTLDRMRVTMKVTVVNRKHTAYLNNAELAGLSIRHNLDLYNAQVDKFVRKKEKFFLRSVSSASSVRTKFNMRDAAV